MKYLLFLIVLLACVLRLPFLGSLPPGFSGDEAQQGYSAYSILKTGKDEWGESLPLFPRGAGDFKPPLYTYLTIPFIALFGLNETAVRLPAALVGIFTVLFVYFLTKELFGIQTAFWSAFLLAINPWHIQLSRTAFEAGSGVLLFALGLLCFLKSKTQKKYLFFAVLLWCLSLYTYHSVRLFSVLYILALIIWRRSFLIQKRNFSLAIVFFIFLLPLVLNFKSTLTRASDVGIFSTVDSYFQNKGTSPWPYYLDRIFDNKLWYASEVFINNYLSYLSPNFYFTDNRPDGDYLNFPGFPLLYPVEIFFWIIGIVFLQKKEKTAGYIMFWFLLSIVPASLAQGSFNAHRAVTLLPVTAIVSGFGIKSFFDIVLRLRKNLSRNLLSLSLIAIFLCSLTFFIHFYLVDLPKKPPESLRQDYPKIFKKIWELEKGYDNVLITRVFTLPQVFVAFYGKVDPGVYQTASQDWLRYEKSGKLYIDQLESWNLEKFLFEDISYEKKDKKRKNTLLISTPNDFPAEAKTVYEIKNSKGEPKFLFVESEN